MGREHRVQYFSFGRTHDNRAMTGGEIGTWQSGRLLRLTLEDGREFRFARTFSVGRAADCDVRIEHPEVSRKHLIGSCDRGRWSLQDQSRNGMFANGTRLPSATVDDTLTVSLGANGPTITFDVLSPGDTGRIPKPEPEPVASETVVINEYADRYFGDADDEAVGERTMMIRRAYERVRRKHQRRNNWLLAGAMVIAIGAGAAALYNYMQLVALRAATQEEFYVIKELDVEIASLDEQASAGDAAAQARKRGLQQQRFEQVRRNERAMNELVYGKNLTETDRLILRVTRRLGECELAAPREYLQRVTGYIRAWQSTGRFAQALKRAMDNGYVSRISEELLAHNLSPDFFYLAMQESSFDPGAIGPQTRYGIAKGMWQFIPETGSRFGLRIGPLSRERRTDADDDRHDWNKATVAAARYIKDIYTTEAEASGLLVMASYNWGEHRIIDRVKELPRNPRDRNFWKLIERFRIPDETYNYVFSIVSAAVIGENPRAFGFDFDNPLKAALEQYEANQ
jgi:hypothetical protein